MSPNQALQRTGSAALRLSLSFESLGHSTHMDDLDTAIREFTSQQGMWLPLERHFEQAFSSPDPKQYYHAIFNLFERFPDDDGAGVFWSALHGIETAGGYEELLLQYYRRHPSLMTRLCCDVS